MTYANSAAAGTAARLRRRPRGAGRACALLTPQKRARFAGRCRRGGIMVAGLAPVVLYLVASFWAWVLGIVVEAVRRDYFDDERNVS